MTLVDAFLFHVKDPFELNLCVTKGYLPEALENWKLHCAQTAQITSKLINKNLTESSLCDIFELKIEKRLPARKQKMTSNISEESCFEIQFDPMAHGHDKDAFLSRLKFILKEITEVSAELRQWAGLICRFCGA